MVPANKKNTLTERWERTLGLRGPDVAIVAADGGVLRTFAELEEESRALQTALEPVAAGALLGIQLGNHASWPALLLAAMRRGLVVLPLGGHMGGAELELALETIGADALAELRGDAVSVRIIGKRAAFPQREVDLLKLTSGTTSAPRAVMFNSAQLVADCDNVCATMDFGPDDMNFGVIPFSHSYGFSNLLTPLLCRGVPLVAASDRMPRAILDGLRASRATVFPGMPVFYQALCGLAETGTLPHLRLCISAGAPLPQEVGRRFTARFGLKVHTFYGASECGGITYDRSDEPSYEEGHVGTPMEGVTITPLDAGITQIEVRSAAVGDGYFPDAEPGVLGAGRFVPGDLIRREEGDLYMAGRVSDVINVAGRKLNPMEVEARIASLPGVRQVVVFGVSSSLRNEEAVACVVTAEPMEASALLQGCRGVLSAWQVPKDVWFLDEIPTNERGKISRRELALKYLARRAAVLPG